MKPITSELYIWYSTFRTYKFWVKTLWYVINCIFTDLTEKHVKINIEPFMAESMDRHIFLKRMNECWQSHCQQMIMIRGIFLYLDRTYVLQNPTIHSIWWVVKAITLNVSTYFSPICFSFAVSNIWSLAKDWIAQCY